MSRYSEKNRFENRFTEDVIEVAVVTGASGVSSGKAGGDVLWNSSIDIIAYKDVNGDKPAVEEEVRLEWLVDDEELRKTRDILMKNSIVRLSIRKGKRSMMLVEILGVEYKDQELEAILEESMKPVYYNDEILGEFEMNKSVKVFGKDVSWDGEDGDLCFDWNEDEDVMKRSLQTAHALFKNELEWNAKIRDYASSEMLELANEWLKDDDDAKVDEITKDMFIRLMEFESMSVHQDGSFEMYFSDGDMFWGHCIIVEGNVNAEFDSAYIAG